MRNRMMIKTKHGLQCFSHGENASPRVLPSCYSSIDTVQIRTSSERMTAYKFVFQDKVLSYRIMNNECLAIMDPLDQVRVCFNRLRNHGVNKFGKRRLQRSVAGCLWLRLDFGCWLDKLGKRCKSHTCVMLMRRDCGMTCSIGKLDMGSDARGIERCVLFDSHSHRRRSQRPPSSSIIADTRGDFAFVKRGSDRSVLEVGARDLHA